MLRVAFQKGLPDTDEGGRDSLPIYRPDGRSLGVSFSNVTAIGASGSSQTVTDLLKIFTDILTWPVNTGRKLMKDSPQKSSSIIQDVTGVLFPGETMLVLGRPGAGCSTVLRVLANQHQSFQEVQGSIQYAGLSSAEMGKRYRSEAVYCAEDDIHLPMLPVKDTLDFALRLRKPEAQPESSSQFSKWMTGRILESLGLSHTYDTRVGDAFVRGVSGGERKRISLAEVLAVNPALACWDNPIRGLDSSSALSFLELLRDMSRRTGMSNVATLYQVSEAMYQYFDRVVVMYEGQMIFCGPASRAKEYFLELGFHCPERQTTADFLTAITSPAERKFQKTFNGPRYDTAESLAQVFRSSNDYHLLQQDMIRYQENIASDASYTSNFQSEVEGMRSKLSPKSATEPSSLGTQTLTALRRQYQLTWRDRTTLITVFILTAVNAVITSSAYYMAPKTATGSFERSGALFFALIYFNLNALTEVPKTIRSRAILLKQHRMGYAHPVALVIAGALAEIPVAFLQALVFSCCYYFTIGLDKTASSFWIFVLIVFTHLTCISCLFRMLGAWAPNLNTGFLMGGCAVPVTCLYSGYAPPVPTMHRWGSWIRRISPTPYGVESLMGNEFAGIMLHCTPGQLIPHGSGYNDIQYQGCPMAGAVKGSADVSGETYLTNQYGFNVKFLWRDFGIILVMWFLYVVLTALGLSIMTRETSTSNARAYRRGANPSGSFSEKTDVEGQGQQPAAPSASGSSIRTTVEETANQRTVSHSNQRTFSFHNVNYFVHSAGQELHLLNNVTGYVKPGQLTALMGGSGAGKTTLLETISGRKTEGRTEGTLLFDGKPLDQGFSRACGFCMQQDVHEPLATVREALQFSAFLRQSAETSHDEKVQDVEKIMELLELDPIADAIVGSLGVEERKRVTIGVELCARPSALLFLDEVCSGICLHLSFDLLTINTAHLRSRQPGCFLNRRIPP